MNRRMGDDILDVNTEEKPCIKCVDDLLDMKLVIPDYQRPYKWDTKNIGELLSDIGDAISEKKKNSEFKYRIGTIIVHKDAEGNGNIVDGQQRVISLTLLKFFLDNTFDSLILRQSFRNKTTQYNIKQNYEYIRDWFSLKNVEERDECKKALKDTLEVVIITVSKQGEAFQLFDSQNARGKALDPHDLLKAYHLRQMNNPHEMKRAVAKWEAKDPSEIRKLFDLYLFPIWNWSRKVKTYTFTTKDIDVYKGVIEGETYPYAKRASQAMPFFQLTEPFVAGKCFFEMIDYYMNLKDDVEEEIYNKKCYEEIKKVLCSEEKKIDYKSVGFRYVKNLFFCALIFFYDKFGFLEETSVKKFFAWAFTLRYDLQSLGFDSVNKYAIGDPNPKYTNTVAFFEKIKLARNVSDISSMQIQISGNVNPENKKWEHLNNCVRKICGLEK